MGGVTEPTATRPHMPGYGIDESAAGLLTWAWAEQRLIDSWRYWLVTAGSGGAPHAMPVWAVWHENALWFSTSGRSRKARNLRGNPRCAMHLESAADPLVLHGVAEFEADGGEAALDAYAAKYGSRPPDPDENPGWVGRMVDRRVWSLSAPVVTCGRISHQSDHPPRPWSLVGAYRTKVTTPPSEPPLNAQFAR
jgi:hypothetical protein